MMITRADTECVIDVMFGEKKASDLLKIVEGSNGILTLDSFDSWDKDPTVHEYGSIISYD